MIRPVPGSQAEPEPSFYELVRESRDAPGRIQGFSPETADIRIAQYESGARMPKHDLLCTLAEALGVSPSALDIPRIKSREVLNQLLLALEEEYALKVTITENNGRSKTDENLYGYDHRNNAKDGRG